MCAYRQLLSRGDLSAHRVGALLPLLLMRVGDMPRSLSDWCEQPVPCYRYGRASGAC